MPFPLQLFYAKARNQEVQTFFNGPASHPLCMNSTELPFSTFQPLFYCLSHQKTPSTHPTHPLTHSPTHPLTHSPTHPLTHSPTHPLTHSPTHPLTHSPTHPLTHSPTHPLTHSPTHPLTHSPTHPLTHSPTHPLTHSPTHPLTPVPSPSVFQRDNDGGKDVCAQEAHPSCSSILSWFYHCVRAVPQPTYQKFIFIPISLGHHSHAISDSNNLPSSMCFLYKRRVDA